MPITELRVTREEHEMTVLRKVLPLCRASMVELQNLTTQFSDNGMKDFFVYLWQIHARCAAELEAKFRDVGGRVSPELRDASAYENDEEDVQEIQTPFARDKALLLHAMNRQTQTLQAYAQCRRDNLPFDVRMMLQRHQLQIRDALERLSALYLAYPMRGIQTPAWADAV